MSHLGKNISANLLANIWSTALQLLLVPLYVRFLGVESYGLIGFYTSWIAIFSILDTGLSATAVREIAWLVVRPEERGKIPVLLRTLEVVYWGVVLVSGGVILAGAWFFGADWFQAQGLSPELVRSTLMLMAISLMVQVPSGLYIGGLIGLQRQVESSGLVATFGTVRGVGAVFVLWLINPDIRLFFMWQIVVSAFQTGVIRHWLLRKLPVGGYRAVFSKGMLHSVKGFAGGMTFITVLSIIISQADKMILSRIVSLESFGFYMLAWTVASGLSRVSSPLIQAFGPRFTELVSIGDNTALWKQFRLSSQLMSVLILPPTALIVFFSKPILMLWMGNPEVAAGTSPILAVVVMGTALTACSYPAVTILYSRKQLRPVIVINLFSLFFLLPLLVVSVIYFGVMGAAFCWVLYGFVLFFSYQFCGVRDFFKTGFFSSILNDFIVPCFISFIIVGLLAYFFLDVTSTAKLIILLACSLFAGWATALVGCKDLFKIVVGKLR